MFDAFVFIKTKFSRPHLCRPHYRFLEKGRGRSIDGWLHGGMIFHNYGLEGGSAPPSHRFGLPISFSEHPNLSRYCEFHFRTLKAVLKVPKCLFWRSWAEWRPPWASLDDGSMNFQKMAIRAFQIFEVMRNPRQIVQHPSPFKSVDEFWQKIMSSDKNVISSRQRDDFNGLAGWSSRLRIRLH